MKYMKVGTEPGFIELIFTFVCGVLVLSVLGIPSRIAGISWAIIRWQFTRGAYVFGYMDSTRAKRDGEISEFTEAA